MKHSKISSFDFDLIVLFILDVERDFRIYINLQINWHEILIKYKQH